MPADYDPARREFLAALAAGGLLAPAAGSAAAQPTPPPDPPRDLPPTGADLGSLFPELEKLAGDRRYALSFLGDRFRSLDEFRAAARPRVFELLGYRPEPVDPKPEIVERVDCGDHVRERVVFATAQHVRVPAYVLVPKGLTKPAPAVVDLHSHGGMFLFGKEKVIDLGRNHPVMEEYHRRNYEGRPTATALVRRGYVVVTIDAFFFGERRLLLDADRGHGWDRARYSLDDVKHLNQQCRNKESTLAKGLALVGLTWPRVVVWDDIRTVDYLVTRPEVDAKRIGCVGVSMGGYRAAYLAALDERVRAACVTGFMSAVRPMVKAHLDTHSWVHFLPGLHRDLDLPDVATLAAPRALMVQQCAQDGLFPLAGMKAAVDTIGAAYAKAGAAGQFAGRFYDVPHRFGVAMQDEAFDWFDRHLKG
jgi:dienelactone hydrolase